jgi:hypothetical protein
MATLSIIPAEIPIRRHEGNTSMLEIEIPDIINMTGKNIHFAVFKGREIIIEKVKDGLQSDWNVFGQLITAKLSESDTKGKAGNWQYELEVWSGDDVYTILQGDFAIIPVRIKNVRHGNY